jgi:O-antigen ligase
VIGSNFALIVLEVAVIGAFFSRKGRGLVAARWLAPLLLATVLALQHRSVWLAGLVGVLLCLVLARTQRVPLWQQIAISGLVAVAASVPLFVSDTVSDQVQSSASRAISGEGTVDARFANWRATISQWWGDGSKSIVLGRDFGSDTTRLIDAEGGTVRISFSAHNHFVDVLTNLGVIGLLTTVLILVYVLFGLWRQCREQDDDSPYSALLLALMGMQLTYYIAYTVDYLQSVILAVSIAWVAGHARTRRIALPDKSTQLTASAPRYDAKPV